MATPVDVNISGWTIQDSSPYRDGAYAHSVRQGITGVLRAFPGAEGYGRDSIGGRGGTVIHVTNLNDSGAGSFREACMTVGPRIIVFDVSGIINLTSTLQPVSPYMTIAGQTSPQGIVIAGAPFYLHAHDVIIRHIRFFTGSHNSTFHGGSIDPDTLDCFDLWGSTEPGNANDAYNVIIDHCSFGWGTDECVSFSYHCRDATLQNCIVAEGLTTAGHSKGDHSKGVLVSAKFSGCDRISLYKNVMMHCKDRMPLFSGNASQFAGEAVNNVIYNWYHSIPMTIEENAAANFIGNYLKAGPQSFATNWEIGYYQGASPPPNGQIYVEGNIGWHRTAPTDPEVWMVGVTYTAVQATTDYQAPSAFGSLPYTSVATASSSMAAAVVADVGATKPYVDSVTSRWLSEYNAGTGAPPADVYYDPGVDPWYPTISNPSPSTDTNSDGIRDEYETYLGVSVGSVSPSDPAPTGYASGYTMMDSYLDWLARIKVFA